MEGTNKRLDGVMRDVQELKTSLEFTQQMMEEMKSGYNETEAKTKSFDNDIMNLIRDIDEMFTKLDYTENQHKRNIEKYDEAKR